MRSFASDNNSGVSAEVLNKLSEVNKNHTVGYGDDKYTVEATQLFKNIFGEKAVPYMVFTGTAANVMSIASICQPYHSVLCANTAHIHVDECAAPQRFVGCRLETVESHGGKIAIDQLKPFLHTVGFEHHSQPRLISITQPTELGCLYSLNEIKAISDFAHENNMFVHMDGARLANAAVALQCNLKNLTTDVGVDLLSFGGTKNGLMTAESVVFLNPALINEFKYIRKQGMQLVSKMRFVAAQFIAYFENDLWKRNADNANNMAKLLGEQLKQFTNITITQPIETNAVFAEVPFKLIKPLQDKYFFYVWNEQRNEVRWMTSFDTTKEDITDFINTIRYLLK